MIVVWPAWPEKDGNISKMVDSPILRDWSGGSAPANSFAAKARAASLNSTDKDDPHDGGDLGTVTINNPGPTELGSNFMDASSSDWNDLLDNVRRDFSILGSGVDRLLNPKAISKREEVAGPPEIDPSESDCRKNVLDPLESIGFNLADFQAYLSKGTDFYDGNSSALDAGTVFQNNFTSGAFPAGFSVSDFYTKTHGKTTGVRPNVYTSYFLSQTRLTVFFNPNTSISSPALLFHEALHGYGAYINRGKPGKYSDENLMNIFGKLQGGSEKITEHIEKYCGSYFNIF